MPSLLGVSADRPQAPPVLLSFALMLFLLSCIFDPADRLLGLKVQLFLLSWLVGLTFAISSREKLQIHVGLIVYTLLFLLVPTLSIAWYWLVNGGEPFEGVQLFKGYLLITLGVLLFLYRVDLLRQLAAVLTMLAVSVILVFVLVSIRPELYAAVYAFGASTGVVMLDNRDYGSGLVLQQIYFVTSPMLAISVAYYFELARTSQTRRAKLKCLALMLTSIVAMLLAGSRNNIAVAVTLPLALLVLHSKHKIRNAVLCGILAAALVATFFDELAVLLDPNEFSNNIKLSLLRDYSEAFNDPIDLLFGRGLGAYQAWEARGGAYYFVSELTYLELLRNFGVFGGLVMSALLLFPLLYAFVINTSFNQKHIVVGYAFYLLMCISNPNLFSSMGILILGILLANIFLFDSAYRRATVRI